MTDATPHKAQTSKGRLVLIPVSLGETDWPGFLPPEAQKTAATIRHFVVETPKAARLQLKRLAHPTPARELDIQPLPERGTAAELDAMLAPALRGLDIGLMSDAGCPAIADPGARLVDRAHALDLTVVPLVGPSSLLLALMGSGLNGQSFAFNGYLPVAEHERQNRLRQIEAESRQLGRTQLFIETPYRNERMLEAILDTCQGGTRLCIARDLNTNDAWIKTQTVAAWRKHPKPDIAKRPAIFLLLA